MKRRNVEKRKRYERRRRRKQRTNTILRTAIRKEEKCLQMKLQIIKLEQCSKHGRDNKHMKLSHRLHNRIWNHSDIPGKSLPTPQSNLHDNRKSNWVDTKHSTRVHTQKVPLHDRFIVLLVVPLSRICMSKGTDNTTMQLHLASESDSRRKSNEITHR
jgi:hypothetical protein